MANYVVIPAIMESTRLPGKLLLDETGKPLIQHTWENCKKIPHVEEIIIATNNKKIKEACENFGAKVDYDERPTKSGTDRVVLAASKLDDCDTVTNVQGEWPCVNPVDIHNIINTASFMPDEPLMASLYYRGSAEKSNESLVKVVVNSLGHALYFSRQPIPHNSEELLYHIGVYSLSLTMIRFYLQMRDQEWNSPMKSEDLEQLQFLDQGFQITMVETKNATKGVDTPDDYEEFVSSMIPELPC